MSDERVVRAAASSDTAHVFRRELVGHEVCIATKRNRVRTYMLKT